MQRNQAADNSRELKLEEELKPEELGKNLN
jgi:hypothetical protein